MGATEIVNKVWNYAHVLRDDGVAYGDYVEQITYLIFLKMADERELAGQDVVVPAEYRWSNLVKLDGDELEIHYRHTLEQLGKKSGMLGTIFRKAQNKIQDSARLESLIKMIDKEAWSTLPADVKGEIYEGLLECNAQDVKGGAGETVRKNLLERYDVHTLLRLPTGIFYAQGVKANVIFFDAKPAWTKQLWVYDYRTNVHKTLKQNRLALADFAEFVDCYRADDRNKRHELPIIERWKAFAYAELIARDKTNLDIF